MMDQRIGASCGVVFIVLLGAGMLAAGLVPPHSPSLSTDAVAELYRQHAGMIRLGMVLGLAGCAFIPPFVATLTMQMFRMQGVSRMPAYVQLAAGVSATLLLIIPLMLFAITAFRPERDPAITALAHDAAWLFFIAPFSLAFIQNASIALGILLDRSPTPVFPRWIAYFNFWTALLFLPGGLAFVLKTGPFAWNGILSFWVAASAFFAWFIVMAIYLFKAIAQDEAARR